MAGLVASCVCEMAFLKTDYETKAPFLMSWGLIGITTTPIPCNGRNAWRRVIRRMGHLEAAHPVRP
jgi:hypothetical protein